MSAAGMAPAPAAAAVPRAGRRRVRASSAVMTLYVMPASFQELRDLLTKIRADFVANIVSEGQFTTPRQRHHLPLPRALRATRCWASSSRTGARPASTVVYLAERGARSPKRDGPELPRPGEGQRPPAAAGRARDSSIVAFERYAVDLSAFNQDGGERTSTSRASAPRRSSWSRTRTRIYYTLQAGRFRAELHDRLSRLALPARHDGHRLRGARRPAHDAPGPRTGDRRRGGRGRAPCASPASRPRARRFARRVGARRRSTARRCSPSLISARLRRSRAPACARSGRALDPRCDGVALIPRLARLRRA